MMYFLGKVHIKGQNRSVLTGQNGKERIMGIETEDRVEENNTKENSRKDPGWKEVYGLGDRICMKIPTDWERPSEKWIGGKFPYSQKPQEILTDPMGEQILTYNLLEEQLQEEQVKTVILEIQKNISHVYPDSIREQAKVIKTATGNAGYFSFVTGGTDGDNGHYMFLLPVCGDMMFGSYHFPAGQMPEAGRLFRKISGSIRVIKTEGMEKKGYGKYI